MTRDEALKITSTPWIGGDDDDYGDYCKAQGILEGYEQGVRDSAKVVVEDVGYDSSLYKILDLLEKK